MDIYVPSLPARLKISQMMLEDFLIDPCLGAEVIYRVRLDAFQRSRLKISWWVPNVIDSSGLGSAKTYNLWLVSNLRCILIPDHVAAIYYPSFETGGQVYWQYFNKMARNSELYRAQIGRQRVVGVDTKSSEDSKGTKMQASYSTCFYKNESKIIMPAGGFAQDAKTQAGLRFNFLGIDEWTKIEEAGSEGIGSQLIGRVIRACFNKDHPLWRNHKIFLATAVDLMHPAAERYLEWAKEVAKGNPDYALLSYSYKDWSDLILDMETGDSFRHVLRDDHAMKDMRKEKSESGFLQECLGIWSKNGKGWYTSDHIDRALILGRDRKLDVMTCADDDPIKDADERRKSVAYFLGIDPARSETKKADDGAMVALRAVPLMDCARYPTDFRLDWIWAYKVRRASAPQWAAIIHRKNQAFGFHGIMMDSQGGGNWIRPELAKSDQLIHDAMVKVQPIACIEDETNMVDGNFILCMFRMSDPRLEQLWGQQSIRGVDGLYDRAHCDFLEAWDNGRFGLPERFRARRSEGIETWTDERRWANRLLDLMGHQLTKISVRLGDQGKVFFNSRGYREFSSRDRKDFAYAAMYAYVRFLIWVQNRDQDMVMSPKDEKQCGGG